jgi:hypothetical protein
MLQSTTWLPTFSPGWSRELMLVPVLSNIHANINAPQRHLIGDIKQHVRPTSRSRQLDRIRRQTERSRRPNLRTRSRRHHQGQSQQGRRKDREVSGLQPHGSRSSTIDIRNAERIEQDGSISASASGCLCSSSYTHIPVVDLNIVTPEIDSPEPTIMPLDPTQQHLINHDSVEWRRDGTPRAA